MSVIISNISEHDDLDGENTYVVHLSNKPPIATFTHIRSEGLALCLRRASDAVAAALAAAPEGFVLVPKEPTEAICDAMVKGTRADISYADADDLWRAALAAAPEGSGGAE